MRSPIGAHVSPLSAPGESSRNASRSANPWRRSASSLLFAAVFLLQLTFFAYVARHRFIDSDEGFYLLASRLVLMHKRPYLDFFYTQAPLLPYVYALWMKFAGVTWVSGKLFAALLTALLGTLLSDHVYQETRNWLTGVVTVVLFASSTLIFAFFPVVKTFSLAGLFLFGAYVFVSKVSVMSPRWLLPAAGLLFGLSVDTRSYLVLIIPVFLWWIVQKVDKGPRMKSIFAFLGGFLLAIIPCLILFLASPSAFLFNNLGYHALRSEAGLIGMWEEKFLVLLVSFLGGLGSNGIQTGLLFFISLGFVSSALQRRRPARLAFLIAVTLGLVSLLPTPVHPQYFCLCIPFLVVSAVFVVHDWLSDLKPGRTRIVAAVVCALLVGVYLAASPKDFRRYLITGDQVAGVEPGLEGDLRLQQVLAVSRAIDEVTFPGETVASFWPGYIFQTKASPLPGFENDFSLPVAEDLTPERRAKYHLLSPNEIEADFETHRPRIVVLRDHVLTSTRVEYRNKVRLREDGFRASLQSNGYTRVRTVGDISIYDCCRNH